MDGINPERDAVAARLIIPANRSIIFFGTPEAVAGLRQGKSSESRRNFNAQTPRALESKSLSKVEFESLRLEMESEVTRMQNHMGRVLDKVMDNASKSLSENLQASVDVKVGELVPLGFFERTRDSLGFSVMFKSQFSLASETTAGLNVVACMLVRIKDRCLLLYATSDRKEEADEQWARNGVKAWRDAIFTANHQEDAPASSTVSVALQEWHFGRILRVAAAVAGIASLIALVMFCVRRARKASPSPP